MRLLLRLSLLLLSSVTPLAAADGPNYAVGDTVANFTLVNRATGQPVSLHDFEGKVVLLDFFAWWCPFCSGSAMDLDANLLPYFQSRGNKTSTGLPFMRVGLNLQPDASPTDISRTDSFIAQHGFGLVLQDTQRAVASLFVDGFVQPVFVVINGVADSPSHDQWELVYSLNNYGSTTAPTTAMRNAINSVAAPVLEPPTPVRLLEPGLTSGGMLRFRIAGNLRDGIRLRRSDDLTTWTELSVPIPSDEGAFLELSPAALAGDRFLQAIRAGG